MNKILAVDAYQAGHFLLTPESMNHFQCSQVFYRKPLAEGDHRVISAGLTAFCNWLREPITQADIDEADNIFCDFHAHHSAPYSMQYPWPKQIFQRVVDEFDGLLPVKVYGLMDGTTHYIGEPCVQVVCYVPGMGELVGWLESTILPYMFLSSTVATRGRLRKERFLEVYRCCYPSKSEEELEGMVAYKFHDFGRRASASVLTGVAHLINWLGTDTMDAVAEAIRLNGGKKFGACSIMAAAHRTITPWESEDAAYAKQVPMFAHTLQSVVADSYDYFEGVRKLAEYAPLVKERGGVLIIRPDSGDPVECVLEGLRILAERFDVVYQEKGLRVLQNAAGIQGDGINDEMIFENIIPAMISAGWCPSNFAFGMGENNHVAKRSDLEACYKTCVAGDRGVMKWSNTPWKRSYPCAVSLIDGEILPVTKQQLVRGNLGEFIEHYPAKPAYSFEDTRAKARDSWNIPKVADRISPKIRALQAEYMEELNCTGTI